MEVCVKRPDRFELSCCQLTSNGSIFVIQCREDGDCSWANVDVQSGVGSHSGIDAGRTGRLAHGARVFDLPDQPAILRHEICAGHCAYAARSDYRRSRGWAGRCFVASWDAASFVNCDHFAHNRMLRSWGPSRHWGVWSAFATKRTQRSDTEQYRYVWSAASSQARSEGGGLAAAPCRAQN